MDVSLFLTLWGSLDPSIEVSRLQRQYNTHHVLEFIRVHGVLISDMPIVQMYLYASWT